MGAVRRLAGGTLAAALLVGAVRVPLASAVGATFGTPSATSTFLDRLSFDQPVDLSAAPTRVELLLTFPGPPGPNVTPIPTPASAGRVTLHYDLLISKGHILPNTQIEVRWRLWSGATAVLGPSTAVLYADT